MKSLIIAPSILSADFNNLGRDIELLNNSLADWIHCDVMDGVFVPNISFGIPVVSHIRKITKKVLDVHLMIVKPERYIKDFKNAGADILTVHYETCTHLHRTVQEIKSAGMKAGVSLNPHTSVALLKNILSELDLVLIMSVNPGFGGQSFIENSLDKISELKQMADVLNPKLIIQVDGGVDTNNSKKIVEAGANSLVAGSSVFKSKDPIKTIELLKKS